MKSKEDIQGRLNKLRSRYARQYLRQSQDRLHRNCIYNYEEIPRPVHSYPNLKNRSLKVRNDDFFSPEREASPSHSVSLVVLQEPSSIRLCLYGSEDPLTWDGELCDNDDKSKSCKWFRPEIDRKQALLEYEELLRDDKYVFENYRDIATLQWVLDNRVHLKRPSLFERIKTFLLILFSRPIPPALPPRPMLTEEIEEIWKDDLHQDT